MRAKVRFQSEIGVETKIIEDVNCYDSIQGTLMLTSGNKHRMMVAPGGWLSVELMDDAEPAQDA